MRDRVPEKALDLLFRAARTANYYQDREVAPDQLRAIWDLTKWGPTSGYSMPTRIVWCTSGDAKASLARCASAGNCDKILRAPETAITGIDLEFFEQLPWLYPVADARSWFVGNEQTIRETAFRNSSLQGAYLIIAARALGFDVGPMSGFDNAAVDQAFFGGTSVQSNFITTLGFADPATTRRCGPRLSFDDANRIA